MSDEELKRKFGFFIFCIFVYAIATLPIERISYLIPDNEDLEAIAGTIEFKNTWKGGERLIVHNDSGNHWFSCRIASSWIIADCPIDNSLKKSISGKKVNILWHKQKLWPLTTRERQVYEVVLVEDKSMILNKEYMSEYYRKQRSPIFSILILIFDFFLARKLIKENRKQRIKNNQKESEKMSEEVENAQ